MYTLHKLPEGFLITSNEQPKGSITKLWRQEIAGKSCSR